MLEDTEYLTVYRYWNKFCFRQFLLSVPTPTQFKLSPRCNLSNWIIIKNQNWFKNMLRYWIWLQIIPFFGQIWGYKKYLFHKCVGQDNLYHVRDDCNFYFVLTVEGNWFYICAACMPIKIKAHEIKVSSR